MTDASLKSKSATLLEGAVEKIVYTNPENAWTVVRMAVPGRRGLVTAVGKLLEVQPGETLRMAGHWVQDKKFGEQFRAESYKSVRPATVEGIRRYLGSGLIRGIGPKMAERLVERFGAGTLEVIESHPERLRQVPGIGPKRVRQILEAWEEQRDIQRVMVFLQGHGISTAFAIRIYKTYGAEAEAVVAENPYRLARDIFGIGFKSADEVAARLGVPRDSPRRAEAGVLYLLQRASDDGHLFLPRAKLVEAGAELLEVGEALVVSAVDALVTNRDLVERPLDPAPSRGTWERAIYLAAMEEAEGELADEIRRLLASPVELPPIQIERALRWFEEREGLELAAQQRSAVAQALSSKVLVITGGPGTGKTTLLRAVVEILDRKGCRIALAAPTGRAARRMGEATGRESKTVHRLLEFDPTTQAFARGPDLTLDTDLVIVDEASMLDTPLARSLVSAVPSRGQLILVGDVDQLPSVGPGRVLADLIDSGALPVVRLTEIFRQAAASRIVVNAHRINQGEMPVVEALAARSGGAPAASSAAPGSQRSDFFFIERETPEAVLDTLFHLVTERIPKGFGLDPVSAIQVLCPMNRGPLGVLNLNAELQQRLNPRGAALERGGRLFRTGDKVMQIRNNYELEVFNGDLGQVAEVNLEDRELVVTFDQRRLTYGPSELDELVLAYACSIHKAQGSEYPCVVVPVHYQHFRMLQRNLLYTALTRARKLVVLVGQRKALATAVRNQDTRRRFTQLKERLR